MVGMNGIVLELGVFDHRTVVFVVGLIALIFHWSLSL